MVIVHGRGVEPREVREVRSRAARPPASGSPAGGDLDAFWLSLSTPPTSTNLLDLSPLYYTKSP